MVATQLGNEGLCREAVEGRGRPTEEPILVDGGVRWDERCHLVVPLPCPRVLEGLYMLGCGAVSEVGSPPPSP